MYSRASALDEYSTELQMVLQDPSEPPVRVSLDYLKSITDDFSSDRRIGRGGFGEVYKGVIGRDKFIAIKKLYAEHVVNDKKYQKELNSLLRIRHQNIVHLIGYCAETKLQVVPQNGEHVLAEVRERLLCFEYIGNGSLRDYILDPDGLGWEGRYAIMEGICKGLDFLHQECNVTHMDLKPENILMDDDMVPKITDFGLARLKDRDAEKSQIITQSVTGTLGYLAPEYVNEGKISHKTDIYSLGVIMCELITGEKVPIIGWSTEFTQRACRKWMEIFEKTLNDASEKELYTKQLKQMLEIAQKCVDRDRTRRPSSSEILEVFVRNNPAERSSCELNSKYGQVIELLGVHPPQLEFSLPEPKKPHRRSSCSLHLTNKTGVPVAFRLLPSETLAEYFLPQSGVVPPNCRYTLVVTIMHHQRNPSFGNDGFFTLESTKARGVRIVDDEELLTRSRETGSKVHEVKIAAVVYAETVSPIGPSLKSDQLARRVPLDGQDIKPGLMDAPSCSITSILVHPTEPWIFRTSSLDDDCEFVVWDYHRLEKVDFRNARIPREDDDAGQLRLPGPSLKFIPQKRWILVGSTNGYIYVYSYMAMQNFVGSKTYLVSKIKSFKAHDRGDVSLDVHPSRPYVLSSAITEGYRGMPFRRNMPDGIKLWDWENGWCCVKIFNNMGLVEQQPKFNPKDQETFLTTTAHDLGVKVWNIGSPKCKYTFPGTAYGWHLDFFTQGGKQFIIVRYDFSFTIRDYHSGTLAKTIKEDHGPTFTVCSHPELPVLINSSNGKVRIWSSRTFSLLGVLDCCLGHIYGVAGVKGSGRIVIDSEHGILVAEIGHMLESERPHTSGEHIKDKEEKSIF